MKKQFKKSMSLFLAVLMLLSSWVWIAPEKASAATISYNLTIFYDVPNKCENGGHCNVWYYPFNSDGTLSTTMKQLELNGTQFSSMFNEADETTGCKKTVSVPGWPCKVEPVANSYFGKDGQAVITGFSINDVSVISEDRYELNPTWTSNKTVVLKPNTCDNANADGKSGTQNGESSNYKWDWKRPQFGLDYESSESKTSLDFKAPSINDPSGTTTEVTAVFAFKDTVYDVPWPSTVTQSDAKIVNKANSTQYTSYMQATMVSTSFSSTDATKSSLGKVKITAHRLVDTVNPNNDESSWKLTTNFTSGGETVTAEADVILAHPTYTISFDGNGGTIDTKSDAAPVTGLVYGAPIGHVPSIGSRYGHKLIGFTKDAMGVSTSLVDKTDGTWLSETTKIDTRGNATWYARWAYADVKATFVTPSYQTIAVLPAKWGNNLINQTAGSEMYKDLDASIKAAANADKYEFDTANHPVWKTENGDYVFTGWKIVNAKDLSGNEVKVDANGNEVSVGSSLNGKGVDAKIYGDTVYMATYAPASQNKYTVNFLNAEGQEVSTKDYLYGDFITMPAAIALDSTAQYDFEHVGWAPQVGNEKYYTVDAENKNEGGSLVVYVPYGTDDFRASKKETYVPVYRTTVREYTVTYEYRTSAASGNAGYGYYKVVLPYGARVDVPGAEAGISSTYTAQGQKYELAEWRYNSRDIATNLTTVTGNMAVVASYTNKGAATYTIRFFDKDGEQINKDADQYSHMSMITQPTCGNDTDTEKFDIPMNIITDDYLYTFSGWSPSVPERATIDADYTAQYTEKEYADVTFQNYDGTVIYTAKGKDNNYYVNETKIPLYDEATYNTPERKTDIVGTYRFIGWKDKNNLEGDFVVPGTTVFTGDITLVAQYETVYTLYEVKFMNGEEVVSSAKYKYGEKIVVPTENPTRETDEKYRYTFRQWAPDVVTTCRGNATYQAAYDTDYVLYTVTWLCEDKSVYNTGGNIYGERISAPVTPEKASDDEGHSYALDYWVKCDADGEDILDSEGNQIIYKRGMQTTENCWFYPVYKLEGNAYEIKLYDADGTTWLQTISVPHGTRTEDMDFKTPVKTADDTCHYSFDKWVTMDGAEHALIDGNVSLKATYIAEEHNPQVTEADLIKYPTCMEEGTATKRCTNPDCGKKWPQDTVSVLTDWAAPTGSITISGENWRDDAEIDYNEVTYVSKNTNGYINTVDLGTPGLFNEDGSKIRQVASIEFFVSTDVITDFTAIIDGWQSCYNYDDMYQSTLNSILIADGSSRAEFDALDDTNAKKLDYIAQAEAAMAATKANAVTTMGKLGLESGEKYIVYIRVADRDPDGAGIKYHSNVKYFSSGTICYDAVAPTVEITGDGIGTEFCSNATITPADMIDAETEGVFTLTVDGSKVNVDAEGKYEVTASGIHTVVVTDMGGNTVTKTFEIKGSHSYRNYTIAPTCENKGYTFDQCTLCNAYANVTETAPIGHNYVNYVDTDPTCIDEKNPAEKANGKRTYTCSNGCGKVKVVTPVTDPTLTHLVATGHKYGEWKVDKEATCTATGLKHRVCEKCAYVDEVEIPVEAGAHKFYRAKTAVDATCTEAGYKNATCKYCGYVAVKVENIPAKGHKADKYVEIEAPTCTAKGKEILTCSVCNTKLGEPKADGTYDITKTKEIDALGHVMTYSETVAPTADEMGYTLYVCARDCGHTEKKDYVQFLPAFKATFKNGTETVATIDKYQGESIISTEVTAPSKAADATHKYTFKGWSLTENGEVVKFPVEVKADAVYYAVFEKKAINYTIVFMNAKGEVGSKVGYLTNDTEYTLKQTAEKSADKTNTYKFLGWTDGTTTYKVGDKVKIAGADVTLTPVFETIIKKFDVLFYQLVDGKVEIIHQKTVVANDEAICPTIPTKAYDDGNHYTFKKWSKAEALKSVTANIQTTPEFTAHPHAAAKSEEITKATCDTAAVYKYTCSCGYSWTATVGTAPGHDWGDPVLVDGKYVKTCKRTGCGETSDEVAKFTVSFFASATATKPVNTVDNVAWGTKLTAAQIPTAPEKASDAKYTYKFKSWVDKNTGATIENVAQVKITENMEFYAEYEGTLRTYTVAFYDGRNNIVKSYKNVPAASDLKYDGATPTRAYNDYYHYTFKGWEGYTAGVTEITVKNVLSDVIINADFTETKHTHKESDDKVDATCTSGSGYVFVCDCGHSYKMTGPALGHSYAINPSLSVPATPDKNGSETYVCSRCGDSYDKEVEWNDTSIYLNIVVKDQDGNRIEGALVTVLDPDNNNEFVSSDTTDVNGLAVILVPEAKNYTIIISRDGVNAGETNIKVNEDGSFTGDIPVVTIAHCSCTCHRDGLWPSIFRFFHKIIKLFVGKFNCCSDPDPRYNG